MAPAADMKKYLGGLLTSILPGHISKLLIWNALYASQLVHASQRLKTPSKCRWTDDQQVTQARRHCYLTYPGILLHTAMSSHWGILFNYSKLYWGLMVRISAGFVAWIISYACYVGQSIIHILKSTFMNISIPSGFNATSLSALHTRNEFFYFLWVDKLIWLMILLHWYFP